MQDTAQREDLPTNIATLVELVEVMGKVWSKSVFHALVYLLQSEVPSFRSYRFRFDQRIPKSDDLSKDLAMLVGSGLLKERFEDEKETKTVLTYSVESNGEDYLKKYEILCHRRPLDNNTKLKLRLIAKYDSPNIIKITANSPGKKSG